MFSFRDSHQFSKTFYKKGSDNVALTEFLSLNPTRIWRDPKDESLVGVSGNYVFELFTADVQGRPILLLLDGKDARNIHGIASPNRIERTIYYVDKLPK